jgi:hypothetical protein
MRRIFIQTPMQTRYGSVRHVEVSLLYVEAILEGEKYYAEPKGIEPGRCHLRGRALLHHYQLR